MILNFIRLQTIFAASTNQCLFFLQVYEIFGYISHLRRERSLLFSFDDRVFWFFFFLRKLKNCITLYTRESTTTHARIDDNLFRGEIYRPINAAHFCESTRFSRSIVE